MGVGEGGSYFLSPPWGIVLYLHILEQLEQLGPGPSALQYGLGP